MKLQSIKHHLRSYSIHARRSTTINHAFASAIAPTSPFDQVRIANAIRFLKQDPDADLRCVYCDEKAHTWDHLVGLVRNQQLHGYGHQIGNLVPCCRECNSRKGNKDWTQFLEESMRDAGKRRRKRHLLMAYIKRFAKPIALHKAQRGQDWKQYQTLKERIFQLMRKADTIATRIRDKI